MEKNRWTWGQKCAGLHSRLRRVLQKIDVEQYFDAEKAEAIVFMVVGAVAIVAALALWLLVKSQWAIGLTIPLLILAVVEITVGWSVYRNADRQRTDVVYAMDLDPAAIRDKEVPRMNTVMRNFVIYRYAELVALLIGVGLVAMGYRQDNLTWWYGLGIGLSVQALILLLLDFFAEKRGSKYLEGLLEWIQR